MATTTKNLFQKTKIKSFNKTWIKYKFWSAKNVKI